MKQMRTLLDDELAGERVEGMLRIDVKRALLAAARDGALLDARVDAACLDEVFKRVDLMEPDDLVGLRYRLVEAIDSINRVFREFDRVYPDLGV